MLGSRAVLLGRLRAEHDLDGIPRRQVEHHEDDDRHPRQDRHQQQEPAREVAPHFSEIVSTRRSKLGWSLNPWTRLLCTAVWISWSTKIHGGSSARMRWALRDSSARLAWAGVRRARGSSSSDLSLL